MNLNPQMVSLRVYPHIFKEETEKQKWLSSLKIEKKTIHPFLIETGSSL